MNRVGMIVIGLLLAGLGGCCHTIMPNWSHPGDVNVQRQEALRYDPYPDNDAAPAVVGVRPREYDQAPPEPSRGRWYLGNWGQQ